jgi:hypothetical protein
VNRDDARDKVSQRHKHPLDPAAMARGCRRLASDLRSEAAAGWPDIALTGDARGNYITRAEAAKRLDEQAERWEVEAAGGPLNEMSRKRIGFST